MGTRRTNLSVTLALFLAIFCLSGVVWGQGGTGIGTSYTTYKELTTAPATPPSTYDRIYFTSAGLTYKNAAGTVVPVLGGFTPLYAADAGSSDTYAITMSPAPTAYATGTMVNFYANTANTGAATLNCNALGAKTIKKFHDQDLETGDIEAAQIVTVIYDGTNFQMQSQTAFTTGTGALVRAISPAISTPTGIVKADVGLGSVDNTSDAAKPVSTATQTALDLKSPLASPTFTGIVGAANITPTILAITEKTPVNAVAAQGTITMSGIAVANETFVVGAQTFTWKAARAVAGEVTIGADAPAAVTNIVTAITADLATVTAVDGAGDTVVITAATKGTAGNAIVLTEASTNMAVDGAGTLGATTAGVDGTVGVANETCADASYLYHCLAVNTVSGTNWRRIALGAVY